MQENFSAINGQTIKYLNLLCSKTSEFLKNEFNEICQNVIPAQFTAVCHVAHAMHVLQMCFIDLQPKKTK